MEEYVKFTRYLKYAIFLSDSKFYDNIPIILRQTIKLNAVTFKTEYYKTNRTL